MGRGANAWVEVVTEEEEVMVEKTSVYWEAWGFLHDLPLFSSLAANQDA